MRALPGQSMGNYDRLWHVSLRSTSTRQSGDHVSRKICATQWTNWARGFAPGPITHDSMRLDTPGRIVDRAISRIEIRIVRVAPQPQVSSNDVQRRLRQSKTYQHVTRLLIDVLWRRNFFANYRFKQDDGGVIVNAGNERFTNSGTSRYR